MIKKRIPEKYEYNNNDLINAIRETLGFVPIKIEGRVITIEGTFTTEQKTNLKNAVLPLLTEIQDITL